MSRGWRLGSVLLVLLLGIIRCSALGRLLRSTMLDERRNPDPLLETLLARRAAYTAKLEKLDKQNEACAAEEKRRSRQLATMVSSDPFQEMLKKVEKLRADEAKVMAELEVKRRECGGSAFFVASRNFTSVEEQPSGMELHRQNDELLEGIHQQEAELQDCVNNLKSLTAAIEREDADARVWKKHYESSQAQSQARVKWMRAEIDKLETLCEQKGQEDELESTFRKLQEEMSN